MPVGADYGRRGEGSILGAFRPRDGEAWAEARGGRTTVNRADFLGNVEGRIPPEVGRAIGIAGDLNAHRATDVLPLALAHPRRESPFQPAAAPHLDLIEPRWKAVRSVALSGRRSESWEGMCAAVRAATS